MLPRSTTYFHASFMFIICVLLRTCTCLHCNVVMTNQEIIDVKQEVHKRLEKKLYAYALVVHMQTSRTTRPLIPQREALYYSTALAFIAAYA